LGVGAGLSVTMAGADAAQAAPSDVTFTLLLVNDIYNMASEGGRGGYPKLAAVVKAERARGVPMLFCHAGDCYSPSLMSGFDQGAHVIELTNMIRPDVFVPGNHEFDFGQAVDFNRMAESNFPYFAANMRQADGSPIPGMKDAEIFTLGPVKVGVVGIALDEGTCLASFADQGLAACHAVDLDEHLLAPLLDVGRDRDRLAVGHRLDEAGVDLEQRRADDATCLHEFAPRRHAALHEERQRGRVHPAREVREEHDAGGVAVAEVHVDIVEGGLGHRVPRVQRRTRITP